MSSLIFSEIVLKSSSTMSLDDRFTIMLMNEEMSHVRPSTQTPGSASLRNRILAQQMANRPSVLAALQNKPGLQSRLGRRTVQVGMGRHLTGGVTRQWSHPRGKDNNRLKDCWSLMPQHNGAHIKQEMQNEGRSAQQGEVISNTRINRSFRHTRIQSHTSSAGNGLSVAGHGGLEGRYWARRRGRARSRPVPTRAELDKELEDYMSMSKSKLDADLDVYMSEVDSADMQ